MKRMLFVYSALLVGAALVACAPSTPSEADIQTAIAQTAEAMPTNTAVPTDTPEPTPEPTITNTPKPTATVRRIILPTDTPEPTPEPTITNTPEPTNTPEVKVIAPDMPEGWEEYELIGSEVVIAIPEKAELFSEDRGSVMFERGNSSWFVIDFGDLYRAFGYRVGDVLRDTELQEDLLKGSILDSYSDLDSIVFLDKPVQITIDIGDSEELKLVGVLATRRDYVYQSESAVLAFWFPAGTNGVLVLHENYRSFSEEDANTTIDIVDYGFNRNFNTDMYWDIKPSDG